jgi:hypothetical protein
MGQCTFVLGEEDTLVDHAVSGEGQIGSKVPLLLSFLRSTGHKKQNAMFCGAGAAKTIAEKVKFSIIIRSAPLGG